MKKTTLFLLLLCLFSLQAVSQQNKKERMVALSGKVSDSFTKMGVHDCKMSLLAADSTVLDTMTVVIFEGNAYYGFDVPPKRQRYIIRAEHKYYETAYMPYELKRVGRNTQLYLPLMLMKLKGRGQETTLGELKVTATKVKMVHRGDTIVFNADAFNVGEGNMLDGLIRQLPGVELKSNGEIFVNGKKVDYLLLNGKTFYQGNNRLMLENLPYYMVKDVKVYNRTTDRARYAGLEDEKKDFVMDVCLKREYRQGYMANLEVGGGTEESYIGRLFGLRFTDHSRLTLIGNLNNLNAEYQPLGNGLWHEDDYYSRDGRTTRKLFSAGVRNETDKWENNLEVGGGWTKRVSEARQYAETWLPADSALFSADSTRGADRTFMTTVSNQFMLKMPFYLTSSTSLQYSDANNLHTGAYASSSSAQKSVQDSHGRDVRLSQSLASTRKTAWGDAVDLNARVDYQHRKHSSMENRLATYADGTTERRHTDADLPLRAYTYSLGVGYTIKDLHHGSYQFQAGYDQQQRSESDDRQNLLLGETDADNSYNINQLQRTGRTAFNYSYENRGENKHTGLEVSLPLRQEHQRSFYRKATLDTCALRRYWVFEPRVLLERENGDDSYRLEAEYTQQLPDVTLLVDRPNTTDPLHTYLGNPSLSRESEARVKIRIIKENWETSKQIIFRTGWTQHFDRITQSYTYNPQSGSFVHRPHNVNGNWDGYVHLYCSRPVKKGAPFYMGMATNASYWRERNQSTMDASNDQALHNIHFLNGEEKVNLSYAKGGTNIDLRAGVIWKRSASDSPCFETVNALHYRYGVDATATLPLQLSFTSSLFMEHRRGYANASLNTNECEWNLTLGRSFLSGKRLLVRLTAVDVLRSHSAVSYHISSSGRTEAWHYSLPSYWLLRVAYKLNVNPKKKSGDGR